MCFSISFSQGFVIFHVRIAKGSKLIRLKLSFTLPESSMELTKSSICYLDSELFFVCIVFKVERTPTFLFNQNTCKSILVKQDSYLLAAVFSLRCFCSQPLAVLSQPHQSALLQRPLKDLFVPHHSILTLPPLQVCTSLVSFFILCGRGHLIC